MRGFLLCIVAILLACCQPIVAHGKGWRGIVPLQSKRADVERLLGPGINGHYQFDEERAHVNYAEEECNPVNGCLCLVPEGTVISIYVQLEVEMKFSKLNIDKKKYEKFVSRKDPNVATYSNDKEGIIYTVNEENDDVTAIEYLPTAKDCREVMRRATPAAVQRSRGGQNGSFEFSHCLPDSFWICANAFNNGLARLVSVKIDANGCGANARTSRRNYRPGNRGLPLSG